MLFFYICLYNTLQLIFFKAVEDKLTQFLGIPPAYWSCFME